ncbi:hypothetical protein [Azospirillum sp. ST 5-10]|uniref:hypothetical protein n=1 Tax=unclassified Azospirillum TaxID=2630922 RepID=UPI003F4A76FD
MEWLPETLRALGDWPGAVALRASSTAYMLVNAAHILAFALLVGAIATLDLRLLGAFRAAPLAGFAPPLARVAATGLALAVLTGLALFSVRPVAYAETPAFLAKLALVGAATANALILRRTAGWRAALAGGEPGAAVRASALLSLALWAATVLAGRWIGFVL